MYYCTLYLLITIIFVVCEELEVYKGNFCADSNGTVGSCAGVEDCPAVHGARVGRHAGVCGYEGFDPVICCIINRSDIEAEVDNITNRFQPNCEPGSQGCPLTKNTRKSRALEKCVQYNRDACNTPRKAKRAPDHYHQVFQIDGGVDSFRGQFPHMALLGYGPNVSTAEWNCGGSIISETFILTAGHCTSGRDIGPVTFAAIGILRRSDLLLQSNIHNIKSIIKHPDYKPPHKYNDIALLKTETIMLKHTISYVSVACLDVYDTVVDLATATGWGALEHRGRTADVLQLVQLYRFSDDVCSKKYPPGRLLKHGFDNRTQMCYGHHTEPKDTCQGDSGGPLQIQTDSIPCLYTVVGVTSFGRSCGTAGEPGIYTRISAYVPWIEEVVWP